jgi:hypothetical protein
MRASRLTGDQSVGPKVRRSALKRRPRVAKLGDPVVRDGLGELLGGIESALFEHGGDRWVQFIGGFRPGGSDVDSSLGVVVE